MHNKCDCFKSKLFFWRMIGSIWRSWTDPSREGCTTWWICSWWDLSPDHEQFHYVRDASCDACVHDGICPQIMNRSITWGMLHVMNLFMLGSVLRPWTDSSREGCFMSCISSWWSASRDHEHIYHVRDASCDECVHVGICSHIMNRFITWGISHVMNLFMMACIPESWTDLSREDASCDDSVHAFVFFGCSALVF